MKTLTFNNHFKFGFDGDWYSPRSHSDQKYMVSFGHCTRETFDWKTECYLAARRIADAAASLPIDILYSGGIDSEVTLMSFLESKIPVTAHVMRFNDQLNEHDIKYALDFCEQNNVPIKIHDIDILRFFERDMYDYADLTQCVSPQLCATMWLVDQLDGYPIIGQGECVLVKNYEKWFFRESEKINSWYRFFIERDREGAPGFFQYTPEQMLSFLIDKTFLPRMAPGSGKISNKTSKFEIYSTHFGLTPRKKYTGFELVMESDALHRQILYNKYPNHDDYCYLEYKNFIDWLGTIG